MQVVIFLTGGRGYDTAVYDGKRTNYRIEQNLDSSYSVTNLQTKEVDTLKEIENIQFEDEEFVITADYEKAINLSEYKKTYELDSRSKDLDHLKKLYVSLPNAIGLGTVSGLNLNLINPYTTSSGNTYYFVDKGGDGSPDTRATVTARDSRFVSCIF